jgi:fructosamine-3-kinase
MCYSRLQILSQLLGSPIVAHHDLGTSHSWRLFRLTLADERDIFAKVADNTDAAAEALAAEAAGLRWLADAGPQSPVPAVLLAVDGMLALPWLPAAAPDASTAERLGRDLALLHDRSPDHFGAPWPGFIADLPLDNTPSDEPWPQWYARRRLLPFLDRARPHLSAADVALVERIVDRIDALAGPPEPPSRIHGDLWSGNIVWTADRAWLVDPAAHGGHRETDLAMLALFGAPHLDRIVSAYNETRPLADGWRERIPLHQLHPLLVHVALFGGSYRTSLVDTASRALTA